MRDPIEELIFFVMHVFPGIKSCGQAGSTLAGVLNTFFREDSLREYLCKNEVMLSTFGIESGVPDEVSVEHAEEEYIVVRFESEKNLWEVDDGSSPG